jgi:superfamily II DNA or RNA helicase
MVHHLTRMKRFICGDAVGLGKAQPLNAKILTPTGWKTMGEMKVGTEVVDPDGGYSVVEGVFPQGEVDIYRVELNDGSSTECCGDHLWTVQTPDDRVRDTERTLTTQQLLSQGLTATRGNGNTVSRFFLPVAVPTAWESTPRLPIPSYTLGALLGDGGIKYGVTVTSADMEIIRRIEQELPRSLHLHQCQDGITWSLSKGKTPGSGSRNPYITALRDLKLFGRGSGEKFIPEMYLRASLTSRMELLRGLMDTDGECSKAGLCYFSTISHGLALGVAELVRSLGGIAKIRERKAKWYSHRGKKLLGQPGYTVTVKTNLPPFHLKRKASRWKVPQFARAITSITYVGKKSAQCIRVSSKRHLYITDDYIVTHNTLDTIAASAWLKERFPDAKIIIVTTKSTTYQWNDEFIRFSYLRPYVMQDNYRGLKSSKARYLQMMQFLEGQKKDVMIVKYSSLIGTRKKIEGDFDENGRPVPKDGRERLSEEVRTFTKILKEHKEKVILVFDECHKFKGVSSSTRKLVLNLAHQASRVWALTATAIKNGLDEFYAIASAVGICPFGYMSDFTDEFCIMREQYVGNGRSKRIIAGYKNVAKFKKGIRPFFLGRSQRQVKEPLPELSTIYHPIDLDDRQTKLLLEEIPSGEFVLPPRLVKRAGEIYEVERDANNMMTLMSVQQLVTNHWALLDRDSADFRTKKLSPKEEALLDMLDGDFRGEKVVVFTKYRSWIDRLQWLTENGHFTKRKFLRITGNENEQQRNENKKLFQAPDSGYDLIVINAAGIEGINLQQAAHMVCLDLPWSWGDLIQLVGRMVRMASPNSACTLHVLVAKGTIDEYTVETLKGKKGVFEAILGESHSAGILDDKSFLDLESGMEQAGTDEEFRALLQAHCKRLKMGSFLMGEQLEAAKDEDYQMAFERKGKKKRTAKKITDEIKEANSKFSIDLL